ncbi:MAG: hypothetical protein IT426_00540 [Pirellulales bacterium]|nr:hypothetical protein [Pirellulales bacterium]
MGYSIRNIWIVAHGRQPGINRPVFTRAAAIGRDFALRLIENYRLGKLDAIGKMKNIGYFFPKCSLYKKNSARSLQNESKTHSVNPIAEYGAHIDNTSVKTIRHQGVLAVAERIDMPERHPPKRKIGVGTRSETVDYDDLSVFHCSMVADVYPSTVLMYPF